MTPKAQAPIFNEEPTAWALYVRRKGGGWPRRPMLFTDHAEALEAKQRSEGGDHVAELRPRMSPLPQQKRLTPP